MKFPSCPRSLEDELGGPRYISEVFSQQIHTSLMDTDDDFKDDVCAVETILLDITSINRRICSISKSSKPLERLSLVKPDINTGATDTPMLPTFASSDQHTDVSPQSLSERCEKILRLLFAVALVEKCERNDRQYGYVALNFPPRWGRNTDENRG